MKKNGAIKFEYPATLAEDTEDGGFVVTFNAFPEIATQGDSVEHAIYEASDALAEAVAGRIGRGEEIPAPAGIRKGKCAIPLPATMAAKAALYMATREAGVTTRGLGRALKCDQKEARRIMDPHHATKIGRLEDALSNFGMELVVSMKRKDCDCEIAAANDDCEIKVSA